MIKLINLLEGNSKEGTLSKDIKVGGNKSKPLKAGEETTIKQFTFVTVDIQRGSLGTAYTFHDAKGKTLGTAWDIDLDDLLIKEGKLTEGKITIYKSK